MILRKRRACPEVLFDPQPDDRYEAIAFEVKDSAPNPEQLCVLHQRQLKTLRAIRRLSPHLRAPIRMQLMHEWSIREISRTLNSLREPLSPLQRARQQLSTWRGDSSRDIHDQAAYGELGNSGTGSLLNSRCRLGFLDPA